MTHLTRLFTLLSKLRATPWHQFARRRMGQCYALEVRSFVEVFDCFLGHTQVGCRWLLLSSSHGIRA